MRRRKQLLADTAVNVAVAELEEFMLLGGDMNNERLGEGNAPALAPPIFEILAFPYKLMTLPMLRDISESINVQ